MSLAGLSGGSNKHPPVPEEQQEIEILSVSEALRILPTTETGEKYHTDILIVRGMISSTRPVTKMVSGEYAKCPKCAYADYKRHEKPQFIEKSFFMPFCETESEMHEVKRDLKTSEIIYDKDGLMVREEPILDKWYEYRNAVIIELQDIEKFDDLERLQVILFDDDTLDIRAGEQVLVMGVIHIEKFSQKDLSLHSRLYSYSMKYEARREISLSSQDVDAIKGFVAREGNNNIIDKLSHMFACDVVGLYNVKKGLLFSLASCTNDSKKPRERINSLLVGEPGLAKSLLLRRACELVPNSRSESAQNSSGKSLTAIVTKEGGENTVLRLGPIPFAKEAVCGLNEIGRMPYDDQAPLLDVLEEGHFTINKYGLNAAIRSPTVIIGSANPIGSKFSTHDENNRRINIDDIPAIKPLIDRFDYVHVVRMSRDEKASMEYAQAKLKYEDTPAPNYNAYLEKHLIYAKRFKPKISAEAGLILNQFYAKTIINMGSPRVRDTLYRTAKMIARLKLKTIVDAKDAREACEFYNVIQNEYNRAVYVPSDPKETAINECLYTLEVNQRPMVAEHMVAETCKRNDYVGYYIGSDFRLWTNMKARKVVEALLENSRVEKISNKPIVLRYIRHDTGKAGTESGLEQSSSNILHPSDTSDISDMTDHGPADQNTESSGKNHKVTDENSENIQEPHSTDKDLDVKTKNEISTVENQISDISDISDRDRIIVEDSSIDDENNESESEPEADEQKQKQEKDWSVRTPEEAQEYIDEVERLKRNKEIISISGDRRSKVADMAEANLSGNGIMDNRTAIKINKDRP